MGICKVDFGNGKFKVYPWKEATYPSKGSTGPSCGSLHEKEGSTEGAYRSTDALCSLCSTKTHDYCCPEADIPLCTLVPLPPCTKQVLPVVPLCGPSDCRDWDYYPHCIPDSPLPTCEDGSEAKPCGGYESCTMGSYMWSCNYCPAGYDYDSCLIAGPYGGPPEPPTCPNGMPPFVCKQVGSNVTT